MPPDPNIAQSITQDMARNQAQGIPWPGPSGLRDSLAPYSRAKATAIALIFALGLALAVWGHRSLSAATSPPPVPSHPRRIVSLAPSVTETLYALGLGGQVAAVTRYCHYPPEVLAKPKVAGFSDVSMEALIRQRPDLVVLPVDKAGTMAELERLGITVMPLDTRSLSGLLSAVEELGQATGHQKEAAQVLSRLRASIGRAQARAAGRRKPGVLFSVMHSYNGLGYISEISAVGRDGFFSQLLEIAGGRNVYQGSLSFPRLSREAIFYLKPEIIVDLVRDRAEAEEIRPAWQSLSSLPAIRDGRLYLFSEESDTVPGPRIWSTIDKLSEAIHPSGPGARES